MLLHTSLHPMELLRLDATNSQYPVLNLLYGKGTKIFQEDVVLCISAIGSQQTFPHTVRKHFRPLHVHAMAFSDHHHFNKHDAGIILKELISLQVCEIGPHLPD